MNLIKFLVYTFIGSFVWSVALAYGGYQTGEHWEEIRAVMTALRPAVCRGNTRPDCFLYFTGTRNAPAGIPENYIHQLDLIFLFVIHF